MVIKFNPEGRVVMVLGHRPEPPDAGLGLVPPAPGSNPVPYLFDRPTDVAWDAAGNIFVSDGYGNSRVVKYDKNGKFHCGRWERRGRDGATEPASHARGGCQRQRLRGRPQQPRIEVFDNDLEFKASYDQHGHALGCVITPGPHQYLYSSNSWPDSNDYALAAVTGEIYKMELDGTMVGKFGKAGKKLGEFADVHEIDCRNPDEIWYPKSGVASAEDRAPSECQPGQRMPRNEIPACLFAGRCALAQPQEIPFESIDQLPEAAGQYLSRRSGGRGHGFEGQHPRLYAHR